MGTKRLMIDKSILACNRELFKLLNNAITQELIQFEKETISALYYIGDSNVINTIQSMESRIDIRDRIK